MFRSVLHIQYSVSIVQKKNISVVFVMTVQVDNFQAVYNTLAKRHRSAAGLPGCSQNHSAPQ